MRIPQRWLDSTPFRFLLTQTGFRRNNANKEYEFNPYFQYKIGPYETDYTLYFTTRPSKSTYYYEIFAKMKEYNGSDLIAYLDYHYKAYGDKKEFLRFIRYETLERLKSGPPQLYRLPLEMSLEWVSEQEKTSTLPPAASHLPEDASPEAAMNSLVGPFSGKIELNNQLNMEKYIQLLILTKGLATSGKSREYLFKNFSNTDMAGILCQFKDLGELRMNTLQKKVAEAQKKTCTWMTQESKSSTKPFRIFFFGKNIKTKLKRAT